MEALFNDSVKLSENQDLTDLQIVFISDEYNGSKVETENLFVRDSINSVSTNKIEDIVKNYMSLTSQPLVLNGSLNIVNLSVVGDITLNGKVSLLTFTSTTFLNVDITLNNLQLLKS